MTTAYERTLSVIETGGFLARISRDRSVPDSVREQARQLLRHYPTSEAIRLAGRCEAIRQDEISKISGRSEVLHPALATWPLLEPFFCDPASPPAPRSSALPALIASSTLSPIHGIESGATAADFQVLGLTAFTAMGCLSIRYRCFTAVRAQVLSRATVVLGSRKNASNWFVSHVRSLDRRQPCTLILNAKDLAQVMDTLDRIEHGVFW